MCGIAGIIDLKAAREVDRAALQRMTDALRHRGPDGEGFFIAPGVGFGHRRLAIIDREGGAQPFHSQSGGVLSLNGEIYNYRALARELAQEGFTPRTRSDTEILAEGWARHDTEFIHRLRGMFAFSFWDPAARRLTLARDRLGEKPLYYGETADGFLLFASEASALIASGLLSTELNPAAVADYFFYGYVPDPKSIYRDIHKLPPAHILTAGPGRPVALQRYWRPDFTTDSTLSFKDAAEALRAHLDDAVSAQMMSDVPLGAFLSGGVDSAGVVASMREAGNDLVTCTIGFNERSHDERTAARSIAEKFNAEHFEHTVDAHDLSLIDDVAAAYDEPFADPSALPSYIVARLARQHVTVALSGDGGDELFAGYRRYPFFLSEEKIRRAAPLWLRRAVFGPAGALYPKLDAAPRVLRFKTTLQALARDSAEGYAAAVAINLPARAQALLHPDLKQSLGGYRPQSVIAEAMRETDAGDALSAAQHADFLTWLPGRMLTKIDRASMAHGLEVRPPLLDHKLVEWAGALPAAYKLRHGAGKRVLKQALAPRLGREFLNRKKQGFDFPVAAWLRAEDANPLDRLEASNAWRQSGLIDERYVMKMAQNHRNGAGNYAHELWSVIMFDAFLRKSAA
jgi:asparagine synthase (glutamine-hydrolysing)